MTEHLIELDRIADNPYQRREVYKPEKVQGMGRSIASDDLQEKPTARALPDGTYQLAFGHTRRESFKWLRENYAALELQDRYSGYSVMPLDVKELTDEEMYRRSVIENVHREDLSPIELAKAMLVDKVDFKRSSDETGQLFGMNGATVRGLIRLLDLPEAVQAKVASGEISQGAARKLLTIARVDESKIMDIAEAIADGEDADVAITSSIRGNEKVVEMWPSWKKKEKPLGGSSLWPLTTTAEKFPVKHLPVLTAADAAKALGIEPTKENRQELDRWITGLISGVVRDFDGVQVQAEGTVAEHLISHGAPADQIEKLSHLIVPPGCMDCPFYAVVDHTHYCGFKACHQRKTKAWVADEMHKISKKLSIAVYDAAVDGKAFVPVSEHSYTDSYKRHAKLVEDKSPDLRLQPHKDEYSTHKWTDSHSVRLVLVGKGAEEVKEQKQQAASKEDARREAQERQWKLERERSQASTKFEEQYVNALFAVVFKDLTNLPALCALVGAVPPKKADKKKDALDLVHRRMADRALGNVIGWQQKEKGPVAVAKHLQGVATSWGVKLPADFLDVAKGFEPLSAETAEKKSKKK